MRSLVGASEWVINHFGRTGGNQDVVVLCGGESI